MESFYPRTFPQTEHLNPTPEADSRWLKYRHPNGRCPGGRHPTP